MTHHLVGTPEIAAMLGVTRQRADQIVRGADDFPEPEVELSAGRVWSRAAVEQWLRVHPQRPRRQREGRPPTPIAARLAQLRVRQGFTVSEVARRVGVSMKVWRAAEAGEVELTAEVLAAAAELLGAHPAELLDAAGYGTEATRARLEQGRRRRKDPS